MYNLTRNILLVITDITTTSALFQEPASAHRPESPRTDDSNSSCRTWISLEDARTILHLCSSHLQPQNMDRPLEPMIVTEERQQLRSDRMYERADPDISAT